MIKGNNQYNFEINLSNMVKENNISLLPLFYLSEKLKKGFRDEISLGDGLKLVINEYKPKKNIVINFKITNAPIEFAYCDSGRMSIEFHTENGEIDFLEVSSGVSALFYLPNTIGLLKVYGDEPLKIISLHCSPKYLIKFLDNSELLLGEKVDLSTESFKPFIEITKSNVNIRNSANQIIDTKFTGKIKNIFLESKVNELIILILEQIKANYLDVKDDYITKTELSKIKNIENILRNNIAEVPSLIELADIASISHTKLNRLFKSVYGNTVFCYLRELRLMKAKEMLDAKSLSITEISFETGWSSPSHFSREFKDKFGLSPKVYIKSRMKI